ncbi:MULTISPECIES: single-stranded DNA-binding protein [Methylocaldum]|jgi:single-stranded DNA-binding protein|uniref:single-stranded DNA-binding protein n=1 Tax=Methylocaldum sp. 14B TaxID=1912213 RepID=UPI00098AFB8F|nr:single-stranded DNA-binding protein [Methylocaldum sp. 14B]
MIDVLIAGRLLRDPQRRTGQSGKAFTTAMISAAVEGADDRQLVSVIAFGDQAERLGRLKAGDSVFVAGPAKLTTWDRDGETRQGLNVTATGILTAYDARKRRGDTNKPKEHQNGSTRQAVPEFDDAIPF